MNTNALNKPEKKIVRENNELRDEKVSRSKLISIELDEDWMRLWDKKVALLHTWKMLVHSIIITVEW